RAPLRAAAALQARLPGHDPRELFLLQHAGGGRRARGLDPRRAGLLREERVSQLDAMYKEIILDHHKAPRNYGPLEGASIRHEGYNPLCGDVVVLELRTDRSKTRLEKVNFHGEGCSICMSSASIMTEEMVDVSFENAQE